MPTISLIAALSENRAIGFERHLPWNEPIPADWDNLFKVTKGKKMIMGRKSYDDPHRISSPEGNYVITRDKNYQVEPNFIVVDSLEKAIELTKDQDEVYILGGQQIFELALPMADKMVLTFIHHYFEGDAFFPEFNESDFEILATNKYEIGENTPYPLTISTYLRKK